MNTAPSDPEFIHFDGSIATQNPQQPTAQAAAVGQGQILAVGSSEDILTSQPSRLLDAHIEMTLFDGCILHRTF